MEAAAPVSRVGAPSLQAPAVLTAPTWTDSRRGRLRQGLRAPLQGSLWRKPCRCAVHASRTALFTDLIQHFDPAWFTGWRALGARLDLMMAPQAEVPRKFRLAFTDRQVARAALRRILAWPIENVVMAHAPRSPATAKRFLSASLP